MDGTIQNYTLDMASDTKKDPLEIKQYDTNSRRARISLVAFKNPWIIPFGCQIHISVRKTDGTIANATCTRETESTVLAPITDQMGAIAGTHLGELYFLGNDGDIRSQTFPVVVREAVTDLDRMASSDDFQVLKEALRDVKVSTEAAGNAAQYATEQGNAAGMAAQRASDAAGSIQTAVNAAAAAKVSETNSKASETAAVRTQQEVTDYVEAQKAAFVGYSKRESDSKYANAITAMAEGEGGVTVEDAWTAPVLGMEVAGRSEQIQTTGAQLLNICDGSGAIAGVNYVLKDGEITLNGTASAGGGVFLLGNSFTGNEVNFTLPNGSYSANGYPENTKLYLYKVGDTASAHVITSGATFTIGETPGAYVGNNFVSVSLRWSTGTVFSNEKIKIMLNAGDTALPWEPYTGGAPSPSPGYPQDIISTGTVSTGAQLFFKDFKALHGTGAEADITDKKAIKITCTNANGGKYVGFVVDDKSNIVGKTLTISYGSIIPSKSSLTPGIRLYWIDNNGYAISNVVYANASPATVTIEDPQNDAATKLALRLYADVGDAAAVNDYVIYKDIMINLGDTALLWEPYTGGKPAPSVEYPQTLEVGVTGAQLFDIKNLKAASSGTWQVADNGKKITVIGTNAYSGVVCDVPMDLVRGKTITLSGMIDRTNAKAPTLQCSITSAAGITNYYVCAPKTTVTLKDDDKSLRIYLYANNTSNSASSPQTAVFGDVMLNYGDTPLPWEPYKGYQSAPITLTEPLRGIGDYRDRIMCRDGVWGIERWGIELTFDGSEDWDVYDNPTYLGFHVRNGVPVPMNRQNGKCNQLRVDYIGLAIKNGMWLGVNNGMDVFAINNQFYDSALSDKGLSDWKAHLAESPLEIVTYLDEPTWEPLPDATQQALNALTTYAGTTHLTITAGGTTPTVTLDYVKDTHKALKQCQEAAREYTDNQIAAIVVALPTATQAAIVDNQTTRLLQEV